MGYRFYNQSKLTADKNLKITHLLFTLDKIIKVTSRAREIHFDMSDDLIFKNRQIKFKNNPTIFVPSTGNIVELSKKVVFKTKWTQTKAGPV